MSRDHRRLQCRGETGNCVLALTGFQLHCTAALASMLRKHGLSPEFEVVEGQEEIYLRALVAFGGNDIEVYVYDDESGYFWNNNWYILERPDFDSDNDLEDAIVSSLEGKVASSAD